MQVFKRYLQVFDVRGIGIAQFSPHPNTPTRRTIAMHPVIASHVLFGLQTGRSACMIRCRSMSTLFTASWTILFRALSFDARLSQR
jgi:hypothetical protein